jgi:hypothetical protein
MYKKQYIKPNTKIFIPSTERHLLEGTIEDVNDPGDWGGAKGGFMEDEGENANSWQLWK